MVTLTAVGQAASLQTPVIWLVVSSVVDTFRLPNRRQFSASCLESIQGLTCVFSPSSPIDDAKLTPAATLAATAC